MAGPDPAGTEIVASQGPHDAAIAAAIRGLPWTFLLDAPTTMTTGSGLKVWGSGSVRAWPGSSPMDSGLTARTVGYGLVPGELDVLLVHESPFARGEEAERLLSFITAQKPRLVLYGGETDAGQQRGIGQTRFANVALPDADSPLAEFVLPVRP